MSRKKFSVIYKKKVLGMDIEIILVEVTEIITLFIQMLQKLTVSPQY